MDGYYIVTSYILYKKYYGKNKCNEGGYSKCVTTQQERPNKFSQNEIFGEKGRTWFLYENIEEITKEGEVSFPIVIWLLHSRQTTRDAIIAGFIHLKYSIDNEIALTHKGIADPTNPEYIEYRDFVTAVKEFVG